MLSVETLLLFIPAITLLVMLPGPDFALISKISLLEGRRQGQAAALGIAIGICLHTILAMLGLSAILARSATLFAILKYAGAAYLLYLGVKALIQSLSASPKQAVEADAVPLAEHADTRLWKHFQTGFLTNALNPKAILYFMVLYPQFLDSSAPVFTQFLEMGLITAGICIAWFGSMAYLLGKIRHLFASDRFQRWLLRLTGGIFIAFSAKLAMQELE